MIIDFRQRHSNETIKADICIVGGGAAGITIARAFIDTNVEVCLLESGGYDYGQESQQLYSAKNTGFQDTIGIDALRLRYFGGTMNHWGGICGPLNKIDFETREWVPYSGWPISKADLESYYLQAHEILDLGPFEYTPEFLNTRQPRIPDTLREKITNRYYRLSTPPTRFNEKYRDALSSAKNICVYLNANVLTLESNSQANRVDAINIKTPDGLEGRVEARYVIVACGAIETPRLLLLSNAVEARGMGNQHDLVGRFYGSHPHTMAAVAISDEPNTLATIFEAYIAGEQAVKSGFCPSAIAQKKHEILNCGITVDGQPDRDTGFDALRQVKKDISRGNWPDEFGEKIAKILGDFGETAGRVVDDIAGNPDTPPMKVVLQSRSEQSPNPYSRVYLDTELDALGQNKVVVDWQLTELDKNTVRVTTQLIAEEFGRLGLGRLKINDWLLSSDNSWPDDYLTCYGHQMGTTRMADDPKRGVVDSNCRVHSMSNLYIAGASVFPTVGYINPTLTIVAVSLRLSDHLKKLVASTG